MLRLPHTGLFLTDQEGQKKKQTGRGMGQDPFSHPRSLASSKVSALVRCHTGRAWRTWGAFLKTIVTNHVSYCLVCDAISHWRNYPSCWLGSHLRFRETHPWPSRVCVAFVSLRNESKTTQRNAIIELWPSSLLHGMKYAHLSGVL